MSRALLVLLVTPWTLTGCFPSGGNFSECRSDDDCPANAQCTRTYECVSGELVTARMVWTIDGQQVSPNQPEACEDAGIASLAVSFADDGPGDTTYEPVSCPLGQILFDKMPPRFVRVSLAAFDADGRYLTGESAPLSTGENNISFDLTP